MKNVHAFYITAVVGISCLALAGCRATPPARPDHPRLAPGAAMKDVTFHSAALDRDMTYRVFLPAQIAPGRRLPVVYLLHGRGTDFREWSNESDAATYAARGLILVMPEGNSSYYTNSAAKPRDRYEDYLVQDLIADVEARFPVAPGRENRAIVGVSMGGFGAVKLALARPELFVFAGGISTAVDAPTRRFDWRRWQQGMLFRSIFGPAGSASRRRNDPFALVETADVARTPYLYLTAGEQEPLLEPNRRFAALLKKRGFAYEFHTKPGGHDWGQWNAQAPGCFESLMAHLPPDRE
jgi:putative tributyrin esterase